MSGPAPAVCVEPGSDFRLGFVDALRLNPKPREVLECFEVHCESIAS
jgi:hypothetical protein